MRKGIFTIVQEARISAASTESLDQLSVAYEALLVAQIQRGKARAKATLVKHRLKTASKEGKVLALEGFFDFFKKKEHPTEEIKDYQYSKLLDLLLKRVEEKLHALDNGASTSHRVEIHLPGAKDAHTALDILKSYDMVFKDVMAYHDKDVVLIKQKADISAAYADKREAAQPQLTTLFRDLLKLSHALTVGHGLVKTHEGEWTDRWKTLELTQSTNGDGAVGWKNSDVTDVADIMNNYHEFGNYITFSLNTEVAFVTMSQEELRELLKIISDHCHALKKIWDKYGPQASNNPYGAHSTRAYNAYEKLAADDKHNDYVSNLYGVSEDHYQGHLIQYAEHVLGDFTRLFKTILGSIK